MQSNVKQRGSELTADYLLTHYRLESINLDPAKIISIICGFDVSQTHGCDDVSVTMVKICDESFPSDWKRVNIVPVHIKG